MGERQAISSEHQPAVVWPSTAERIRELGPGQLCAVYTDFDAGVRGVEVISADGAPVSTAHPTREHYSWLVHPIGFDERLSVYGWHDGTVARITVDGQIEELGKIRTAQPLPDQWRVTGDGRIVTAVSTETGVTILTST